MRQLALLVAVALGALAAGCGGGSYASHGSQTSGPVVKTIGVSETEFALDPSSIRIDEPGTYVLTATNDGTVTHALELEGQGVEAKTGEIAPGSSADLRVSIVKSGSYVLYCPIGNHRGEGMEARVVLGSGGAQTTTTSSSGGLGY